MKQGRYGKAFASVLTVVGDRTGFALVCFILLGIVGMSNGASQRFYKPSDGSTLAKDVREGERFRVDGIEIVVKDAFDGATSHSEAEQMAFGILNKLHIESKQYVIRRRLLFKEGDTVNGALLRETEKNLRSEEFLADAYVELLSGSGRAQAESTAVVDSGTGEAKTAGAVDGGADVGPQGIRQVTIRVTTFDQWTLAVSPNGYFTGGQLVWWLGLVESNILGHGQRLAFFISHGLERNSQYVDYANTYFTPLRLSLAGNFTWASDGYSYSMSVAKPLRSREQKWSFNASTNGSSLNEFQYLSGNALEAGETAGLLPDTLKSRFRKTNYYGYWDKVGSFGANVSVTRTFGYRLKASLTPYYARYDKYLQGSFHNSSADLRRALGLYATPNLYTRHNEQLGLSASLYQYDFKTVSNFRNLKWSENVEVGWRLTTAVAQNQEWLGANQDDWYFSQTGVFNNTWMNRLFLNTSATLSSYLTRDGDWKDGSVSANFESQFKPVWWTSSQVSASYGNYFATAQSRQYTLGEDNGLNGYPNFFYAGQAHALFAAEQRLFTPWEFATVVPAFAVFLNAGNAWDSYENVDLNDLHYSVGLGLRLGLTRSVQKIVNHVNLTFPLGNDNLSAWAIGVKATKGL